MIKPLTADYFILQNQKISRNVHPSLIDDGFISAQRSAPFISSNA